MITSTNIDPSLQKIESEIVKIFKSIDKDIFDIEKNPFNFMGKAARAKFTLLLGDILGVKKTYITRNRYLRGTYTYCFSPP